MGDGVKFGAGPGWDCARVGWGRWGVEGVEALDLVLVCLEGGLEEGERVFM